MSGELEAEISVVTCSDEKIFLNTFMTSLEFAKARFSEKISERGVLAKKIDGAWNFESWNFEETNENSLGNVILEGKAFKGDSLKNLFAKINFSEADKINAVRAGAAVVSAIEDALNWKQKIPAEGGGAIFVSSDFTQIIFLPELFFESAVLCCRKDILSEENGFYVNENLSGTQALKFIQASIAYKVLSGDFPFQNKNREQRAADILDKNFIPAEIKIPGLNKILADSINSALSQEVSTEHKKKSNLPSSNLEISHFPRTQFFEECGLLQNGELSEDGKLLVVNRTLKISDEKFSKNAERSRKKREARVKNVRWLRKSRTLLIIIAAVLVVGIFTGLSFFFTSQEKPSSQGLTSRETVEMFYSAMNTLDVDQAIACSKSKEMKSYTGVLSNIYISYKARAMYNTKLEARPLSQWLCLNQTLFSIEGLSQFKIQGEQGRLLFEAQNKNQHVKALTEENGESLSEGKTLSYKVTFYTVLAEQSDSLTVNSVCDTVKLEFSKNRWQIISINRTKLNEEIFSIEEFVADYEAAVEKCGKNIDEIMTVLENKYYWLPSDSEIDEAVALLETKTIL